MEPEELDMVRTSIRALHQHFRRQLQRQVEQLGFTLPQMRLLQEVVARPGPSIKDLAANLAMTQSTVSGIVDRLVDKRVLTKRPHPGDRRAVEVWPAAAVERFMAEDRAAFVNAPVAGVMDRLSPQEQAVVLEACRLLMSGIRD